MKKILILLCALMVLGAALSSCSHKHAFGDWQTVTEPLCGVAGLERRVCDCGEGEERELAAKGGCEYGTDNVCVNCYVALNYTKGLAFSEVPEGEGYWLTGIGTADTVDVVVPYYYEGEPVCAVSSRAFMNDKKLSSIALPTTVERIGTNAFYGCTALKSVSFMGDGLTHIDGLAFHGCAALGAIALPATLREVGLGAFAECTALKSVDFGTESTLTTIEAKAFEGCTKLTELTLPASLTHVYQEAFKDCTALNSVTFSNPTGWRVIGATPILLDVTDAAQNAAWLKGSYCEQYWKRG